MLPSNAVDIPYLGLPLPPLERTSFGRQPQKLNPAESLALRWKVEAMDNNALARAVQHTYPDGLNLPLSLAQRVLLHGWSKDEGAQEAETIGEIFATLVRRLPTETIRLETPEFSLWGLFAHKLIDHQWPHPDRSPSAPSTGAGRSLGFTMIFPPSCPREEHKYRDTEPARFLALAWTLRDLGIRLPTSVRWVSYPSPDPATNHDIPLHKVGSVLLPLLNDASRASMAPALALARATDYDSRLPQGVARRGPTAAARL